VTPRQQAAWAAEIESDFSPGGRGMFLLERLDEFLAEAAAARQGDR